MAHPVDFEGFVEDLRVLADPVVFAGFNDASQPELEDVRFKCSLLYCSGCNPEGFEDAEDGVVDVGVGLFKLREGL